MSIIKKVERNISLLLGGHRNQVPTLETVPKVKELTRRRAEELKTNYGEKIKNLMDQSRSEGVEYGAMLCTESTVSREQFALGTGSTRLGCITKGAPIAVLIKDCRDHIHPIGTLHTHFKTEVFSVDDILVGIHKPEMLTCLAFTRGGVTHLACVSPWLYNGYPIHTRTWIMDSLDQTRHAYRKISELRVDWAYEFEPYAQGKIRFEDMSLAAQYAYQQYRRYITIIETLRPAVEELLGYTEVTL